MIDKVLESCQEFYESSFDNRSNSIFLNKEADQMFLHAHVVGVDHSVDFGGIANAMIINLINQQLEVLPGGKTKLELIFLGCCSLSLRSFIRFVDRIRCTVLDRVFKE